MYNIDYYFLSCIHYKMFTSLYMKIFLLWWSIVDKVINIRMPLNNYKMPKRTFLWVFICQQMLLKSGPCQFLRK